MSDDRMEEMIELGVCLLEHIRWQNDAYIRAKKKPDDDQLYSHAHMLGEGMEDVKRAFADAIIDVRLDLNDRVRAVCPIPSYAVSKGRIISTTPMTKPKRRP